MMSNLLKYCCGCFGMITFFSALMSAPINAISSEINVNQPSKIPHEHRRAKENQKLNKEVGDKTISVTDLWVPEAPPTAKVHAAYLSIHNTGSIDKTLISIASSRYAAAEIHMTKSNGDVTSMHLMRTIKVPASGTVQFKPGHLHLMLIQPREEMSLGSIVDVRLNFDDGSEVSLRTPISKRSNNPTFSGPHHAESHKHK